MPVTILVRSGSGAAVDPERIPALTFDGGRIVIGRSAGSDVRLPDPSVSLRHASIRAQGAEYALVDEGSSNGTWVGGVKLSAHTPRLVRSGDLVRVGRVWLELAIGQRAPTPDLGLATRDLAFALVQRAMDAVGDDTRTRLRVVEGPDLGAEMPLADEGRDYVIGRGETCDLPLADEDASRQHVAITRKGSQVWIRDLDSRNGVFLGEARIEPGRDVVWRPQTMARIGNAVIALEEPVSLALAELEAAEDERLPDADEPPPAPPSVSKLPVPPPSTPASVAPAESAFAEEAQVAEVPRHDVPTVVRRPRRVWTAVDVAVVTVAVLVIGASLAGLVWVLRP